MFYREGQYKTIKSILQAGPDPLEVYPFPLIENLVYTAIVSGIPSEEIQAILEKMDCIETGTFSRYYCLYNKPVLYSLAYLKPSSGMKAKVYLFIDTKKRNINKRYNVICCKR